MNHLYTTTGRREELASFDTIGHGVQYDVTAMVTEGGHASGAGFAATLLQVVALELERPSSSHLHLALSAAPA